jgi:hypothetical protein
MVGFQGSMTPAGGWESSDIEILNEVVRIIWERNYKGYDYAHSLGSGAGGVYGAKGVFLHKGLFSGNGKNSPVVSSAYIDFWEYMQEVMTPTESKRVELYKDIFPDKDIDVGFLVRWRQLTNRMVAEDLSIRVRIFVESKHSITSDNSTLYLGKIGYCPEELFKHAHKSDDIEDGIQLYYDVEDCTSSSTPVVGANLRAAMECREDHPVIDKDRKRRAKVRELTLFRFCAAEIKRYLFTYVWCCLFLFVAPMFAAPSGSLRGEWEFLGGVMSAIAVLVALHPLYFRAKRKAFFNPCVPQDVYPTKIKNRLRTLLDDTDKSRVISLQNEWECKIKDFLERKGALPDYKILEIEEDNLIKSRADVKISERPYLWAVFQYKDSPYGTLGGTPDFPPNEIVIKGCIRNRFANLSLSEKILITICVILETVLSFYVTSYFSCIGNKLLSSCLFLGAFVVLITYLSMLFRIEFDKQNRSN